MGATLVERRVHSCGCWLIAIVALGVLVVGPFHSVRPSALHPNAAVVPTKPAIEMMEHGTLDRLNPMLMTPARRLAPRRAAATLWQQVDDWIRTNYRRAPTLMIGLAAVLMVPFLAVLGFLARHLRSPSRQRVDGAVDNSVSESDTTRRDGLTWPVDAWIEIDGQRETRRPIVHDLMRIGREPDNEIVVPDERVHRYHAAIRRTEDAEIVVLDLSPPDGNGLFVNDDKVAERRLRNGDVIRLGETRLKFTARPA